MTTRWRPDFDPQHLTFLTTTAARHTHIFQRDIVKRILLDTLYHTCQMNKVHLYAYVLMPNHVQPHWHLADNPEGYRWSSARYYHAEEPCLIPVRDARGLLG